MLMEELGYEYKVSKVLAAYICGTFTKSFPEWLLFVSFVEK
jgi:hypothetical protein